MDNLTLQKENKWKYAGLTSNLLSIFSFDLLSKQLPVLHTPAHLIRREEKPVYRMTEMKLLVFTRNC